MAAVKKEPKQPSPKKQNSPVKKEEPLSQSSTKTEPEAEQDVKFEIDHIPTKGEKRWNTLAHNGVIFAPPYEPHNIPIRYNGTPVHLVPLAEEAATLFAANRDLLHYYQNPDFRRNFFADWLRILNKYQPNHPIQTLDLCSFDEIANHLKAERDKRKALPKEEKKAIKALTTEKERKYATCLWDGVEQSVGNFKVEPPSLFRGRGKHPLQGRVKPRVQPEEITINIGENEEVPPPPEGRRWKEVKHDQTVTWLAMWQCPITENHKYVMLAANSKVKGDSDLRKFEIARNLYHIIDKVRDDYSRKWYSNSRRDRQLGVASYFIDRLALRAGNEKDENEADTVGCCTLRVEHITMLPNNQIHMKFLGKDSVEYNNTVTVEPRVHELVSQFCENKRSRDMLYDRIDTTAVNDYLHSFSSTLTAKVFRTYNASRCLQDQLQVNPPDMDTKEADKVVFFNKANTEVARLCNHQKQVNKNFDNDIAAREREIKWLAHAIQVAERLKSLVKKNKEDQAEEEWYQEWDKIQQEWMDEHGSDDDKKKFEEDKAKRRKPGTKRPSGVKKERDDEDEGDDDLDAMAATTKPKRGSKAAAAAAPAKKKATTENKKGAKKAKGEEEEVPDEDEDETLAAVAKKASPSGKKSGKAPSTGKKASKKAAPKKGGKKGGKK